MGTTRNGEQYQKIEREGRVVVEVSCNYQGKAISEKLEFVIRVNKGMSQDAVLGKAERKAKAWLYNYLTDQAISDGEAEAAEGEPMRNVTAAKKVVKPAIFAEEGDYLPGVDAMPQDVPMFGQLV